MLRRVLRPNLIKTVQPLRGGGGWPRPDVPLIENYEHKRPLSIFDMNVWWYDGVMPEYVVSYQDQHLHDQYHTVRAWGQLFPPLFAAMFVAGVYMYTVNTTKLGGLHLENESGAPFIRQLKRTEENRTALKKNFLNLNNTGENGLLHASADGQPARILSNEFIDGIRLKKTINAEAKNYVTRVEKEVREKYGNPQHGHGH